MLGGSSPGFGASSKGLVGFRVLGSRGLEFLGVLLLGS